MTTTPGIAAGSAGLPHVPPPTGLRRVAIERFAPVLRRLEDEGQYLFGAPVMAVEVLSVEARPFSEVARVRVSTGSRAVLAFVKMFRLKDDAPRHLAMMRERIERDFETSLRVSTALASVEGCAAVRPLACLPEHLALVTEEAGGETLSALLERRLSWRDPAAAADMEPVFERVGRWLNVFQACQPVGGEMTTEAILAYLEVRLRRLGGFRSAFDDRCQQRVVEHVRSLVAQLAPQDLQERAVHGDFALGNVLVDGERVTVLDFAMASRGLRLHDLAHAWLQLDLLCAKPKFRPSAVRRLHAALLRGYDPTLETAHPLFRLLVLQHVLTHLTASYRREEPWWTRPYSAWVRRRHWQWLASGVPGLADNLHRRPGAERTP